ncbi:MAG: hypothetical protein ACKV2V_23560 [Blastocatellia bacterium]
MSATKTRRRQSGDCRRQPRHGISVGLSGLVASYCPVPAITISIEQATTASPEALGDFSTGAELQRRGQQEKAPPFFRFAARREYEKL